MPWVANYFAVFSISLYIELAGNGIDGVSNGRDVLRAHFDVPVFRISFL